MDHASGLTLLELVIVLSIASVLAGTTVLAHQALRPGLILSMAARQVVMDLKIARMRAVTDHVSYRLRFPGGSGTYQAQRKSGTGYDDEGRPVPLPQGIIVVDCTGRDQSISFVPRGNAGSFGTVTIGNARGEARHISVNIAGQVRVY